METSFHFQHLCVTAGIWQPVAITGNKQDAKYTALFVDCSSWFTSSFLFYQISLSLGVMIWPKLDQLLLPARKQLEEV